MWRTFVSPVLHRPVALLRITSGSNSSQVCFVHGNHAGENDANQPINYNHIVGDNILSNISKAQHAICSLLDKKPDIFNKTVGYQPLLNIISQLERIKDKQADVTKQNQLVICSPRKEKNEEQSGFGFKNVCLGIEKWCYGVVVVSSLISWHRLFLNDDIRNGKNDMLCHIYNDTPTRYSYVLPINGPAKPVDPIDAAFSAFEDALTDGTAVTQNALGIKLSALNMPKKALTYFKSASNKGNTAAHFNLGICYQKGIGTATNISKAIDSYRFAAAQGHSQAAYNLGGIYLEGQGISQKRNKGLELIEDAAKKGLVEAQRYLGLHYADESNEHYDMKISVKWLQVAADKNDMTAQYHLGICYERGLGVGRSMKQAKKLYEEAADNGHVGAQYNIGVFYEHGFGGLCINKQEALRWYKMASNCGNMNAKHNLECLQKEIKVTKKENSGFLLGLLPDIWGASQELVTSSGVLPRCSSSPSRLYLTTELSQDVAEQNEIQNRTCEDNTCIWVI